MAVAGETEALGHARTRVIGVVHWPSFAKRG
jgi:hypothetical protein